MKKAKQPGYEQVLQWFRDHAFAVVEAPGASHRATLTKLNCSAAIEQGVSGAAKIFAYPGCLVGGEIAKLVNRGYQQFLKTTKLELPATAEKLTALNHFVAEFKQGLGLTNLYNESLGTTSEDCIYDRIVNRDLADRPKRPWERRQVKPA
ncbi:MAG: hypothetical protein ABSD20_08505 [Terriglobales bacterium]